MTTTIAPAVDGMSMKSDRQVIEGALALLEVDRGWTQGTYYRDADGCEMRPSVDAPDGWVRVRAEHVGAGGYRVRIEPGAAPCSFCLQGALRAAGGYWHIGQVDADREQIDRLETLLLHFASCVASPGWASLPAYNDDPHTTQADAVLVLKRAAAHLETRKPGQP